MERVACRSNPIAHVERTNRMWKMFARRVRTIRTVTLGKYYSPIDLYITDDANRENHLKEYISYRA